jgi:TonB family protein
VAFREGKSLLPSSEATSNGNSALELYTKVLAQDPQNEEARDGLRRLFAVSSARIRANLNAGKEDDAARLLNAFRGVGIDPAAIAKLEAEIVAARPRALIAQTRAALSKGDTDSASHILAQLAATDADRATIAALQLSLDSQRGAAKLGELASHARSLIKTGALLDPANDNAQATVLSMQQLNRVSPVTQSAEHELQSALLDRTLIASRAGQFDVAQQLLNAAAILGNGPELTAARNQVQAALEAATRARPAAPAAAPPPVADTAAPDFVRPKPLTPLNVIYPAHAFEIGQSGSVVVEFTLDSKGRATDPKVIESNPSQIFDDAAMQAITRGRFQTSELGPSGEPRRARIRIAFKPDPKQPVK